MEITWSALKRPKVYVSLVEVALSLIGVIMLLAYEGLAKLQPDNPPTSTSWVGLRVQFKYPFDKGDIKVRGPGDPQPDDLGNVNFSSSIKTSAEFLLGMFIIGALLACVRLLIYACLKDSILKQRLPPFQVFFNGLTSVMLLVSAIVFIHHVKSDLKSEVQTTLASAMNECVKTFSSCKVANSSSVYALPYVSGTIAILLSILWSISCWLAYRNTYLHRPYYVQQQEAGEGPGALQVASNVSDQAAPGVELQSIRRSSGPEEAAAGYGTQAALY